MIGDGIDSYCLTSKDLEARVDGLIHRIGLMADAINNNAAQLEFLTQVVDYQQAMIEELKKKLRSICAAFQ